MLSIAITGGIGSGKTQASEHIRSLGYTVVDADAISRELTAPGGRALPLIRENFGDTLFNNDGTLNRAKVREVIYADPDKKALYESCTTKLVLDELAKVKRKYEEAGEEAVFFDIPLLFETHTEGEYDIVMVISCDEDIRKRRVMERSNIDEATVDRIMKKQTPEEVKVSLADIVIYNNGTIAELETAVDKALKTFLN